jgi:hypothetical protein
VAALFGDDGVGQAGNCDPVAPSRILPVSRGARGAFEACDGIYTRCDGFGDDEFLQRCFQTGRWEAAAREVQCLWIAGRRPEAIAKVPPEMVIQANLLGDTEMVRNRIRTFRDAGVTTLRVAPQGRDLAEKLATLGSVMDLVRG